MLTTKLKHQNKIIKNVFDYLDRGLNEIYNFDSYTPVLQNKYYKEGHFEYNGDNYLIIERYFIYEKYLKAYEGKFIILYHPTNVAKSKVVEKKNIYPNLKKTIINENTGYYIDAKNLDYIYLEEL